MKDAEVEMEENPGYKTPLGHLYDRLDPALKMKGKNLSSDNV